jgi:hypothetical protein
MERSRTLHDRLNLRCRDDARTRVRAVEVIMRYKCTYQKSTYKINYCSVNEGGGARRLTRSLLATVPACCIIQSSCRVRTETLCLHTKVKGVHDRPQMTDPSFPLANIHRSHLALELGAAHPYICNIATRWALRFTLLAAPIIFMSSVTANWLPYQPTVPPDLTSEPPSPTKPHFPISNSPMPIPVETLS